MLTAVFVVIYKGIYNTNIRENYMTDWMLTIVVMIILFIGTFAMEFIAKDSYLFID